MNNIPEKKLLFLLYDSTVIYLILVMLLYLSMGEVYHNIQIHYIKDYVLFRRWGDAMLIAFPLLFVRKKILAFPYLLLINLYFLSIVWYYRVYSTIMPLSSYLMVYNLDGLSLSIFRLARFRDIFVVFPSVFWGIYYCFVYKKINFLLWTRVRTSLFGLLLFGGIITYYACKQNPAPGYESLNGLHTIEPVRAFKEFGFVHYWIYQIGIFQGVSEKEKEYAREVMRSLENGNNCAKKKVESGRNLILILVESLHSWPIGMCIDGVEITPHINFLLKQNKTVYFPKEMPQVKDGRSSDAQLIINTGILPLLTGAASACYAANTFPSLPAALREKGYMTASFLWDDKNYWNQEAMSHAYHFERLYDRLRDSEKFEQADEQLFEKTLPLLVNLPQPFYAQIVTMSSHYPWIRSPHMKTLLDDLEIKNEDVKNYMVILQYVDECTWKFVIQLKERGIYDNSIIVITGDHDALPYNEYEGREELRGEDCFVPFIILNSPLTSEHTNKVIGQVDIYPSLLDLMGCTDYSFTGLGESVFSNEISDFATYRTGISAGGVNIPDSVKTQRERCWILSDILLRMDYFKTNTMLSFQ